ncbi:MAG: histidine phosphatase family protein [Micrococcales bacterium]|nr:histidine phosphatase family protein [Micrococcales bacterium]
MTTPLRTVVHLMRHGEVHNPDGVLYGRLPEFHLSELGRQMAHLTAAHLADHDITLVVASPLERAQETAEPVARAHGLPILTDSRLIEAGNHFEGKGVAGGQNVFKQISMFPKLINPFSPSWGEPYVKIAERMTAAVHDARERAAGHEAVLVSHQLPVWTMRNVMEGRRLWHDPRRRECTLASLTTLTFVGEELESVTYSEPAASLLPQAKGPAGA